MAALPGQAAVAHDGEQPCSGVAFAIPVEIAERAKDRILYDVLRVMLVAE
jgi:hypothetical protein